MSAFLELSKVAYKNLGRRRYQYFAEDGELVADVAQIHGGKPRGRLARMFAPERDYSNAALRAASPDGNSIFTISREMERTGSHGAITLYSPDGKMVGGVRSDPLLDGDFIMQNIWRLVDQEACVQSSAVQRLISKGRKPPGNPPVHSEKIDYANTYGTEIAFFDGKWITLERELPEFLQLLVVASPIAFDLLDGA
ncbi:hypothetical protein [Actinomadura latina]|uniref:Uncharacterized protein n=1 Tax=Actinomadura latina TaxID=163603 RepID=A0A846YV20_9ACTN|nr:hypothetical protein [Actinomadura latina]NKZ02454.1 hypothetical protein [Actinomadura latina]